MAMGGEQRGVVVSFAHEHQLQPPAARGDGTGALPAGTEEPLCAATPEAVAVAAPGPATAPGNSGGGGASAAGGSRKEAGGAAAVAAAAAGAVPATEDGGDCDDGDPPCEICNKQPRRYRCPRCSKLTCSLACCAEHKARDSCSGKRDVTKFVPLASFTTNHLRSDYLFLEDLLRRVDGSKRTRERADAAATARAPRSKKRRVQKPQHPTAAFSAAAACGVVAVGAEAGLPQPGGEWLAKAAPAAAALVRHANAQGINLLLMPAGMARHDNNTSRYLPNSQRAMWKVEWVFRHARSGNGVGGGGGGGGSSGGGGGGSSSGGGDGGYRLCQDGVHEGWALFHALRTVLQDRSGNAPLRHRLMRYCSALESSAAGSSSTGVTGAAANCDAAANCVTGASGGGNSSGGGGGAVGKGAGGIASSTAASSGTGASGSSGGGGGGGSAAAVCGGALRLFLRRADSRATRPCYSALDGTVPLAQALRGLTVIEHPTVVVALPEELGNYVTLVQEVKPPPQERPHEREEGEVASDDAESSLETSSSDSEDSDEEDSSSEGGAAAGGSQGLLAAQAAGNFLAALGEIEAMDLEQVCSSKGV